MTGKVSDSDALDGRWDSVRALVDAILRAQKSNPWGLRNADFTELLAALAELEAGE